jgi:hypothetical protein
LQECEHRGQRGSGKFSEARAKLEMAAARAACGAFAERDQRGDDDCARDDDCASDDSIGSFADRLEGDGSHREARRDQRDRERQRVENRAAVPQRHQRCEQEEERARRDSLQRHEDQRERTADRAGPQRGANERSARNAHAL